MKRFTILGLLLASCAASSLMAQQSAHAVDMPAEANHIFGDDGDKVQIVPAGLASAGARTYHGGAVLKSAQQVSIFWGSGWAKPAVRARETALVDLPVSDNTLAGELQSKKIKILRAAPSLDDLSDLSQSPVNDLAIQRKLAEMLQNKAIPAPGEGTIYVIYLAQGVSSSIGAHQGGVDYAAYHNVVNLEFGEVRYAVVPYNPDAAIQRAAAARAFVEAVLNPTGQGWY